MKEFSRTLKVIDESKYERIVNRKVLIVGLGGVGGYALEALVRFGIKNITVIDKDVFDVTNLNRQVLSLQSNIGESKVSVALKRAFDINPEVNIIGIELNLDKDSMDSISTDFDYIIDACDTVTTKLLLIKFARTNNIKIISCMGTGNRIDSTKLEITSLDKTSYDPLAKIMRKLCKDEGINDVMCVWSREEPVKSGEVIGSTSLVPSVAGIYCASYVINN